MTEQEQKDLLLVDELVDKIKHNRITNINELIDECERLKKQVGYDLVDENLLSDMEWNYCDLCGALYPSDELCWTDYLEEEYDHDLIEAINLRGTDITTICYECVKELKK